MATLRSSFRFQSPHARRIQRSVRLILLNLGIIVFLIAVGTGMLDFISPLSELIRLHQSLLGLIIGGAVLALCVPPAIAIRQSLLTLTDGIAEYVLPGRETSSNLSRRNSLRVVLRDSILILILVVPIIWSVPFISRLLSLGTLSAPLPILLLIGVSAGLTLAAFQIHGVLETTFSRTFLGTDNPHYFKEDDLHFVDDDVHLRSTDNLDQERYEGQD
jgi:hypothetical protein